MCQSQLLRFSMLQLCVNHSGRPTEFKWKQQNCDRHPKKTTIWIQENPTTKLDIVIHSKRQKEEKRKRQQKAIVINWGRPTEFNRRRQQLYRQLQQTTKRHLKFEDIWHLKTSNENDSNVSSSSTADDQRNSSKNHNNNIVYLLALFVEQRVREHDLRYCSIRVSLYMCVMCVVCISESCMPFDSTNDLNSKMLELEYALNEFERLRVPSTLFKCALRRYQRRSHKMLAIQQINGHTLEFQQTTQESKQKIPRNPLANKNDWEIQKENSNKK